jgi:hypothetical protein
VIETGNRAVERHHPIGYFDIERSSRLRLTANDFPPVGMTLAYGELEKCRLLQQRIADMGPNLLVAHALGRRDAEPIDDAVDALHSRSALQSELLGRNASHFTFQHQSTIRKIHRDLPRMEIGMRLALQCRPHRLKHWFRVGWQIDSPMEQFESPQIMRMAKCNGGRPVDDPVIAPNTLNSFSEEPSAEH